VITHVTSVLAQDGLVDLNFAGLVDRFWANTIDGLSYGSIYALVAIGYTLVYGVLRLINFAHSEIFVIGIFAAYSTFAALGFVPGESPQLGLFALIGSLLVTAVVAMAASGGSAVLLERVCYRPLRKRGAPPLVFLITAIGASFAIQQIFLIMLGANSQPTIRILRPTEAFEVFGARVTNIQIMTVVAAVVLMVVADTFVNRTRLGRGVRAVSQDPATATLMGVNRERVFMLTFLLGGVLAGAAALFYLMTIPAAAVYNGGFLLGIKAFTAAVLGGIGNLRGALLGGLVLGVVENYGQTFFGGEWRDVIAFVLLIIVLMFRPTGILGESLAKARA
jgi:branched-chain amino acid transport system permease protein